MYNLTGDEINFRDISNLSLMILQSNSDLLSILDQLCFIGFNFYFRISAIGISVKSHIGATLTRTAEGLY